MNARVEMHAYTAGWQVINMKSMDNVSGTAAVLHAIRNNFYKQRFISVIDKLGFVGEQTEEIVAITVETKYRSDGLIRFHETRLGKLILSFNPTSRTAIKLYSTLSAHRRRDSSKNCVRCRETV